jgi:hypothetical protein
MEPDRGSAVCPSCGRRDEDAVQQPIFVVMGASGSGKTAIFGPLAKLLVGRCVVFESIGYSMRRKGSPAQSP